MTMVDQKSMESVREAVRAHVARRLAEGATVTSVRDGAIVSDRMIGGRIRTETIEVLKRPVGGPCPCGPVRIRLRTPA